MPVECGEDKQNLGVSKCNKILQLPRGFLEVPPGFFFTPAQMADADLFKAAVLDLLYGPSGQRGYLWPFAQTFENVSEAAVYQETPLSDLKVRDGKYRFRMGFAVDLCLHKAMYTHRSSGGKSAWYILDIEDDLYGTLDTNGNLYGFVSSLVNTEKLVISDGSIATTSPLYIVLRNNKDLDLRGGRTDGSVLNLIQPLTDATLTVVGTPTATKIVISVLVSCDGTPVNGLDVADFIKLTALGVSQTITSITEANGVYTLNGTGFTTGTVDLDTPDTLTVPGYESDGPVTVTIP